MKRSASSKTTPVDLGNESFFQIQDQAVPYIDALAAKNPNAFRVLLWLMGQANQQNKVIADQTRLGKELALHRNTVSKAVAYLREQRFLQTYKAGTTTGYCLNAWVVWRDGRSKRQKALFLQSLQAQAEPEKAQYLSSSRSTKEKPYTGRFRTSDSLEHANAQNTSSDNLFADPEFMKKAIATIREGERRDALERAKRPRTPPSRATRRSYEPPSPTMEDLREAYGGEDGDDEHY